ncbi:hypothetical protein AVEN_71597-1 [Araneus ventricosus]|uniref:Kazal-like domain-containing protein n=1 Tax=Araneus ventricosus TaxID=182803 RepID=A0A4Y2M9A0_ARAVE|nr:hypothetical protein AVEN_71597-1 [Araneus ventricosus]
MTDPCEDKECHFGAQCRPSPDGQTGECVCPEKCATYGDSRGSRPVCGTDGQDYPNVCELRRTACKQKKEIEAKFQGPCVMYQKLVASMPRRVAAVLKAKGGAKRY